MKTFSMSLSRQLVCLLGVSFLTLSSARADVLFYDNFDADTYGTPAASLLNWHINVPSVDVVGPAGFAYLCNGSTAGNCLDMDGSPAGNGQITTKLGLNLAAGNYTFSFDYGNNAFNNNSLSWNIGSLASGLVNTGVAQNNTYTTSSTGFTLSTAALGVFITFTGGGTADLGGTVLDNVLLVGPAYSSVPEPSTFLILGIGLLGLRVVNRNKN